MMIVLDFNQLQLLGKRLLADDESAFTEIYQLTHVKIFAYAAKILKNREDAEEAVNDAYQKLWAQRYRWCPTKGGFGGWFLTLMKRRILDAQRAKKARIKREKKHIDHPDMIQTSLEVYAADPKPAPLESIVHQEQMQAVYAALLKIEHVGHRMAWRLNFLDGYKYREIACILAVPVGTAKMWCWRCMQALRRILSDA